MAAHAPSDNASCSLCKPFPASMGLVSVAKKAPHKRGLQTDVRVSGIVIVSIRSNFRYGTTSFWHVFSVNGGFINSSNLLTRGVLVQKFL